MGPAPKHIRLVTSNGECLFKAKKGPDGPAATAQKKKTQLGDATHELKRKKKRNKEWGKSFSTIHVASHYLSYKDNRDTRIP